MGSTVSGFALAVESADLEYQVPWVAGLEEVSLSGARHGPDRGVHLLKVECTDVPRWAPRSQATPSPWRALFKSLDCDGT